jgi:hypothetical protein
MHTDSRICGHDAGVSGVAEFQCCVIGTPRAFEVFMHQRTFLHSNERLLYPVDLYL